MSERTASNGNNTYLPTTEKRRHSLGLISEDDFIVIEDVPIFDEFDEYPEEDLKKIVVRNNARIADTGDYSMVTIGHTDAESPEVEQPEGVGWAGPYRMGTIGNVDPRPCVLARFRIRRNCYEEVKKYPRRSIELFDDYTVDPVALLGASAPKRNLGLLFSKKRDDANKYSHSNRSQMNDDEPDKMARVMKAFREFSKIFKEFEPADKQDKEPDDDDKTKKEDKPEKAEKDDSDDKPEKKDDKKYMSRDEEPSKYRMERDQARAEVAKFQRDAQENKKELETLSRKFRKSERERDLIQLRTEGFELDVPEELNEVLDLEPTKYSKHLERIRKRYSRSLSSIPQLNVAPIGDAGGGRDFGPGEMSAAIKASASGKDYFEAVREIKNGRLK